MEMSFCIQTDPLHMSVVLIDSGGAGSNKEAMPECVARRHQLPLMEKTELNIVC